MLKVVCFVIFFSSEKVKEACLYPLLPIKLHVSALKNVISKLERIRVAELKLLLHHQALEFFLFQKSVWQSEPVFLVEREARHFRGVQCEFRECF